jgi:outer membrane lipoprotein carrier protein
MTMRFGFIALILLATLAAGEACARQLTPVEGLEAVRRSFAGMSDFTAEITQEKQLAIMKRKLVSTGVVRFKKPDSFFMEINPPHASRLLLKNSTLSLYLVREKSSQQITLPPEQSLQRWFGFLARPVTTIPDGVDVKADQQGDRSTLTITPRGKGQLKAFTLTILEDGRLKKLVIEEQNGDRTTITFSRFQRNVGLTDNDFRLEP